MPSESFRPPLSRRGNLTHGRGDRSSRRALVGNGDVTDLREWDSHPLFFLRAGLRNGAADKFLALLGEVPIAAGAAP